MNSLIALELGLKGMAGIFTVLGLLAACVWLLSDLDKKFPNK